MNRSPLATDVRGAGHSWVRHFKDGAPYAEVLTRIEGLRDLLTQGGRTLAQGALGRNLARSPHTFSIPGFKTEDQVRDNLGALEKGPLPATTALAEIEQLLQPETEGS